MIVVKDLVKKFAEITAVAGISFEIDKGEVVGFLGPNGAGKTTTMRILTGFLPATSGEVKVAGIDITEDSFAARKKIGYLAENNPLYHDQTPIEYLEYLASLRGIAKSQIHQAVKEVIASCGLRSVIRQDIGKLSKGFQQRVGLASTLLADPEILMLDEPTTGLDPNQRVEIRELIKRIGQEKTVIICSHILSEVEATCNRVLIINQGKIVASGTPKELESQATKANLIWIKIEGQAPGAENKLPSIKGVEKIQRLKTTDVKDSDFNITFSTDQDGRKEIIHGVLAAGYELLELRRREVNLEEVFAQLTKTKEK